MMENKTKIDLKNKSIFITGVAGFIGSNLAKRLLSTVEGVKVVGLDNMNHYYDVRLKEARLNELEQFDNFSFVKGNLADKAVIESIFEQYKPEIVVNLGAQAGVRYSITNPDAYVEANLIGFYNILEACRHSYDEGHTPVEHLVYASSSSVYGSNKKVPYSTDDKVDNPVSLYAATKKSNELMAHGEYVPPINYDSLSSDLEGAFSNHDNDNNESQNRIIACHGVGSDLRMYAAQDVPEREPQELVSEYADERQTEPASGADRGSSGEPGGNPAGQPEREVSGTEQGAGPAGMGGTSEQPDGHGRRDRLEGIKEQDPLAWAAHQNSLTAMAEETVLKELVYN